MVDTRLSRVDESDVIKKWALNIVNDLRYEMTSMMQLENQKI